MFDFFHFCLFLLFREEKYITPTEGLYHYSIVNTPKLIKIIFSPFIFRINMGRKFFVGGNWKMNGTKESIDKIVDFLTKGPLDPNTG